MSRTTIDAVEAMKPDGRLGLVVEDQRTGDLRQVVYADARVVLVRDETDNTTLQNRDAFERALGSRYQPRPDAHPKLDGGPYDSLRARLEEYERADGRKAAHKAAALRETFDVFAAADPAAPDPAADESSAAESDPAETDPDETHPDDHDRAVPFEEVPGIGPKTAGNLRTHSFVTESDVRAATDEELLGVSGLGPESLANLREYLA